MEAGGKKDLVGIDVADSRDHLLVEKERFDPAPAAGKKGPQAVGVQVKRIGPEPAQFPRPGRTRGQERADEAEFSDVPKTEITSGPAK
jgi:hypothetical protein